MITPSRAAIRAIALAAALTLAGGGALATPPHAQNGQQAQPEVNLWGDEFEGDKLDESKWEVYTFDGGGGAKVEVKENKLSMHGIGESRSGVRTKEMFTTERFYVEASLAKVGGRLPQPGQAGAQLGFAILTVLFDGNPRDRLEWVLRSDGIFEAWQSIDGKMVRLDDGKLATKTENPQLGIARRGEKVYFMLNRQVGLEKSLRGLSPTFKVMLYGFGSTQNDWNSLYVQTPKG
jgi:hypothetical protein